MAIENKLSNDNYKFEIRFAIIAILLAVLTLGLLGINIYSDNIQDGIRDFIAEEGLWAKSQKTAVINLIYYVNDGDPGKYQDYEHQMDQLLKNKTIFTNLLDRNNTTDDSLFAASLASATPANYQAIKTFYQTYSSPLYSTFLPDVETFDKTITIHKKNESLLLRLQRLGEKIRAKNRKRALSASERQQYLDNIYGLDSQFTALNHQLIMHLSKLSQELSWHDLVNLIVVGCTIILMGIIVSIWYIGQLSAWRKKLSDKYNELKLIFANTMEGILLVNDKGAIVNSNPFANTLLAKETMDNLAGKNITDVLEIDYNEALNFRENLRRQKSWHQTLPLHKKDGTSFYAEVSASVARRKTGEKFHCVVIKDETDNVEYISKINASEKTYRYLLDSIQDGILIQDKNGMFIQANPAAAQMFGYSQSEFAGNSPADILSPESIEQARKTNHLEEALEGKQIMFERRAQTKDGATFPMEVTLSKGKYFGHDVVISIIRDISDRHKTINELQQANKRNKVLLQEIHHRVKNNMALVSGLLHLHAEEVEEQKIRSTLLKSQNRIHTIADIHEFLYQSKDLSSIDFKSYVDKLKTKFNERLIPGSNGSIRANSPSFALNVNQAIPAALLVNEILMNILDYQISNDDNKVAIDINVDNDWVHIDIRADGRRKNKIRRSNNHLGLEIIQTLTQQLDASLDTTFNGTSRFEIRFKRKENIIGSSSSLNFN